MHAYGSWCSRVLCNIMNRMDYLPSALGPNRLSVQTYGLLAFRWGHSDAQWRFILEASTYDIATYSLVLLGRSAVILRTPLALQLQET